MKLLLDNYDRKINYLRLSITDRCNLRCRYCMPEEGVELVGHKDLLTYEEIVRTIEVFARNGITKIRLTGGEPLVRRGVVDLIKRIARIEGVKDLSLTTNGVLLKDYARDLAEAGLRRINISLDTLQAERFAYITRRDRFKEVWEGIEETMRQGFSPVKINVVVMKGFNDDELRAFARLSLAYPLHIRFIEFMPVGGVSHWDGQEIIPFSRIMEEIKGIGELVPMGPYENGGPAKRYYIKGGKGEIGFISPITSHFCAQCNRLRLTPDGKIRTCLFSDEEIDLKGALRKAGGEAILEEILYQALQAKPEGHRIGDIRFKKCQRGMHAIGG
ncbi:MAG: cyclic pyranopterin phosphate synthase MoaA [Deltaproteobacteria bacterium RBG_16_54_11]|nr:MAG: cyclic pyranopterin phosphate synthase MoaA [Deltaproteobacteria bacterium RBG_16_54_11]